VTDDNKDICVIARGNIGLRADFLQATKCYKLHGVDTPENPVGKINIGNIHVVESALDIFVKSAFLSGILAAGLERRSRCVLRK
jgi:UDP-N-acetyl-D-mannosaminuronic acid dehydrogenase